jgi:hypothetical protein
VNQKLVHEGRGNVEPILYVIEIEPVPKFCKIQSRKKDCPRRTQIVYYNSPDTMFLTAASKSSTHTRRKEIL